MYRLICKGTVEERMLHLARNKKDVQDIVVGNKSVAEVNSGKEIVSMLLDDEDVSGLEGRTGIRREADHAHCRTRALSLVASLGLTAWRLMLAIHYLVAVIKTMTTSLVALSRSSPLPMIRLVTSQPRPRNGRAPRPVPLTRMAERSNQNASGRKRPMSRMAVKVSGTLLS